MSTEEHPAPDLLASYGTPGAPTALVIDDSPENRYAVRRALERDGFDVWEAETGEQGIGKAAENPDVVVLDVELPDIHGFEVCRRLKADAETASIPVLHISAASIDDAAHVHGLEGGADAYLNEPVSASVLVATVRALLRLRRAEDELRRRVGRANFLGRLNAALSGSLTQEQVVDAFVGHTLHELGARDATLYLLDRGGEALRAAHATGGANITRPYRVIDIGDDLPVTRVARTGEAMFGESPSALAESFPELADQYCANGGGSWAVVPLSAYGRVLGALVFTFVREGAFGEEQRDLLVILGERCGQALERAGLYEEQRHIATTLQSGLKPARLPQLPGVDLGVRYVTGTKEMQVGGDFYDIFADGEDWFAVVGDACGRGAEAVTLTCLARHTIRAEARHHKLPSEILSALHDAIALEHPPTIGTFVTAACLRLHRDASGLLVTAAAGGHPRPVVIRADGQIETVATGGPLIGIFDEVSFDDVDVRLKPGDAIVLYTDGVTEARRGHEMFGDARLLELLDRLSSSHPTAQVISDAIVEAAEAYATTAPDDVAVLTLLPHLTAVQA